MNDENEEPENDRRANWAYKVIRGWFIEHETQLGAERGHQIAVWMAARSTAREFPKIWAAQNDTLIIPTLWALTISRVLAAFPILKNVPLSIVAAEALAGVADPQMRRSNLPFLAAVSAASSIGSIPVFTRAENPDNLSAIDAASYACSSGDLYLVQTDLRRVEENAYKIVDKLPLWHGEDNRITADYVALKQKLQRDFGDTWSFFLDDYDRQLAGETPDWHVLMALAHPAAREVWESNDPKQLADYIRQIQEARDAGTDNPSEASDSLTDTLEAIARKTPIGANLQLHVDSDLIEEVSLTDSTDHQLGHAIDEMREALHTFDDLSGNVGPLIAPVRRKLERLLSLPNPKANRVFSTATKARLQIIQICHSYDLGDPAQDPYLNTTIRYLETAAACVIFHEDVKPIIDATIDVAALGDALDISKVNSDFHKALALFANASVPDLALDIQADQKVLQDPQADDADKQDAYYYASGRLVRAFHIIRNVVTPQRLVELQNFLASEWGQWLINQIFNLMS